MHVVLKLPYLRVSMSKQNCVMRLVRLFDQKDMSSTPYTHKIVCFLFYFTISNARKYAVEKNKIEKVKVLIGKIWSLKLVSLFFMHLACRLGKNVLK